MLYRFNKEPHEALKYFNEAAALYKNHSNNKDLSPTFNEIGLCYRDMNDSKSAFDYYSKAIETSPNDSIRKVKEYNNIGELYIISGDYKKADKYLADALAYSNQYTRKDLGRIYQNMGIVQDSIGTELKALEYYLLAYNTKVFDLTDPEYLDIIDRLFHLNKDTNPTLSMQYGSEVILAARTLRDLQKDMESLKKQYEVNAYLLEQKNQNQKLAMQDQAKQNIIVKGVISLIACGLMISLVTYIRKRNDKLIEKSDDIGTGTDL
ncbi:MAG: tetratricopeptide repeat protein [Bacteroidota bacterium]